MLAHKRQGPCNGTLKFFDDGSSEEKKSYFVGLVNEQSL